jgi:2-polyprenyl-6-methoxyphenol hydroxylase-like FAD-dependent oxidoreductase
MGADSVDVVIVGGGIGGSSLAAVLAAGGLSVTVLERTTIFPDRVRGEMYAPWGVAIAEELGLVEPLIDAGAIYTTEWVWYDGAFPPEVAEELGVHIPDAVPGSRGILNFTHPEACQALSDHAARQGACVLRGVESIDIDLTAARPRVTWFGGSGAGDVTADLVIGADGRASGVRKAARIELHSAPVRQYMTGGLVESDTPLSDHIDSYGTGHDVNWYSFPQGPNTSRVYLTHFDVHRYAGPEGSARYLADLRQCASPDVASLSAGRLVRPIATHTSVDTWTDEPFGPGVVLVGDAAGYNDPIVGQGLSLTMADVRDVSRVILDGGRHPADFEGYGRQRADRHAKQRMSAQTMAEMLCAFGTEHDARRLRALPLLGTVELVGALVGVLFAGPDILPPGTDVLAAARERFLAA